jgi:hypothetical protein
VRTDVDENSPHYEACDDGNGDNNDACLNTCRTASCGDGVPRIDLEENDPDFEACDDGNDDEEDECSFDCRWTADTRGVVYHNFEDPEGAIPDLTGNDNDGVLRGPTFVEGAGPDGSTALNIGGNYTIPSLVGHQWGDQLTVAVWIRWSGRSGSYRAVVGNGYWTSGSWEFRFGRESGGTKLNLFITTVDVHTGFRVYLPQNEWHHVALTYDGEVLRAYLDHELQWERPATGALRTTSYPIMVGGISPGGGEPYSGQIDDLRIYDEALTAEELP